MVSPKKFVPSLRTFAKLFSLKWLLISWCMLWEWLVSKFIFLWAVAPFSLFRQLAKPSLIVVDRDADLGDSKTFNFNPCLCRVSKSWLSVWWVTKRKKNGCECTKHGGKWVVDMQLKLDSLIIRDAPTLQHHPTMEPVHGLHWSIFLKNAIHQKIVWAKKRKRNHDLIRKSKN